MRSSGLIALCWSGGLGGGRVGERGGGECSAGGSGGAGECEGIVIEVFDGMCEFSLSMAGIKGGASADKVCWADGDSLGEVDVGGDGEGVCDRVGVREYEGGGDRVRICIILRLLVVVSLIESMRSFIE